MQYGHETQFAAKFVFTKREQSLSDGLKQDGEGHGFVFQDEGIQLMGQRKYDVEVGSGQQFGFSGLNPTLPWYVLAGGAMPVTAGVIPDTISTAVVAAIKMTSQIGGAAVKQVGYDAVLIGPEGI
jgi:hypothetical protein